MTYTSWYMYEFLHLCFSASYDTSIYKGVLEWTSASTTQECGSRSRREDWLGDSKWQTDVHRSNNTMNVHWTQANKQYIFYCLTLLASLVFVFHSKHGINKLSLWKNKALAALTHCCMMLAHIVDSFQINLTQSLLLSDCETRTLQIRYQWKAFMKTSCRTLRTVALYE